MSTENVAVIQGIYDAFSTGDVPGVLGRMSPDMVWNEAEDTYQWPDDNVVPFRQPQ